MAKMQTIEIRKDERVRVIRRFSNSMRMTYRFTAEPVSDGGNLSGVVEVAGSNWIFPKAVVRQDLKRDNAVDKGAWDTFYSVYVTPDCPVKITVEKSRIVNLLPILLIALVIATLAASFFFDRMN
jgi:hypothetical protein